MRKVYVFSALAVLQGCRSTKPGWLESDCCCMGNLLGASDIAGGETGEAVEAVSLLQTSAVVSGRKTIVAANQGIAAHQGGQHDWDVCGVTGRFAAIAMLRVAWLWSPLLIIAAVCTCMRQQPATSQANQFGGTSALTGFRVFLALWIMLGHAGLHGVAGSGAFVILSGVVLSTSRRASPGVSSYPIDSFSSYFRFLFLRLARIIPLYWFFWVALPKDDISLDMGPAEYFACMPRSLVNAWVGDPLKMMLFTSVPKLGHCWFVQTVAVVYLFYPILERLALGPQSLQPAPTWRISALFGMCCLAKLATGIVMVLHREQWGDEIWWYNWKGWSLYGNPILRLPEFMMGVLVPHLAVPHAKNTFTAWAPVCTDFLLCFMVIMALVLPWNKASLLLCKMNIEAPLLALVMWGLCFGPQCSPLGRLFSRHFLVTAGEWSYGIYLFHPSVLITMGLWDWRRESLWSCGQPWFKSLAAAFIIVLLMSWSTFVLIERPVGQCVRGIVRTEKASS